MTITVVQLKRPPKINTFAPTVRAALPRPLLGGVVVRRGGEGANHGQRHEVLRRGRRRGRRPEGAGGGAGADDQERASRGRGRLRRVGGDAEEVAIWGSSAGYDYVCRQDSKSETLAAMVFKFNTVQHYILYIN